MNAAGIDVSKGKSMVSVMRPFGEVVAKPFTVRHTGSELKELADYLKSLDGETRVVMEHTGRYYELVAQYLHDAGLYVSAVNPKLIKDYGNNSLRKVKTDKADSRKIAKYALGNWVELRQYAPMDTIRYQLKILNRQCNLHTKSKTMLKNNLIALLDQTYPGVNNLFDSPVRSDGHQKWVDFSGVLACGLCTKHEPGCFCKAVCQMVQAAQVPGQSRPGREHLRGRQESGRHAGQRCHDPDDGPASN